METTLDYLKRKYNSLKDNYSSEDKIGKDSCLLIALEVAKRLLPEGKNPYLLFIEADEIRSENGYLHPKQYFGRVEWGGHIVCCEDNMIYDPIVGKPLIIQDYFKNTFFERE